MSCVFIHHILPGILGTAPTCFPIITPLISPNDPHSLTEAQKQPWTNSAAKDLLKQIHFLRQCCTINLLSKALHCMIHNNYNFLNCFMDDQISISKVVFPQWQQTIGNLVTTKTKHLNIYDHFCQLSLFLI